MLTKEHLNQLEQNIGYAFQNRKLLERALMHSSYIANDRNHPKDNERMEFLGDAVLELCVSEELFLRFPTMQEGRMSRNRASIVCESALFEAAKQIDLGSFLLLGRGEERAGGRNKPSILSDAFEAVICAVYLDGGLEPARRFIHRYVLPLLDVRGTERMEKDYKTHLQELLHVRCRGKQVHYRLLKEEGPDHQKVFTIQVLLDDEVIGVGTGGSKQSAGQAAAKAALAKYEDTV